MLFLLRSSFQPLLDGVGEDLCEDDIALDGGMGLIAIEILVPLRGVSHVHQNQAIFGGNPFEVRSLGKPLVSLPGREVLCLFGVEEEYPRIATIVIFVNFATSASKICRLAGVGLPVGGSSLSLSDLIDRNCITAEDIAGCT